MAAKAPAKTAKPKVKASKAKAKTRYTAAQQKAYTAASRTAVAKARGIANAKAVQQRRAVKVARSKARPYRSGKRLKPVSGKQAAIRLRVQAGQAYHYALRTRTFTYQQALFISQRAATAARKKALSRVLARRKPAKTAAAPKKATARRSSPYAAAGAAAGRAAAAKVSSSKKVPAPKKRKAAGITPAVNPEWITAGNDRGVENCTAVALANHLLLHTGRRVTETDIKGLSYRFTIQNAVETVDYERVWEGVGLREYGMVKPEEARPGDIVGFNVRVNRMPVPHCGVLMPENKVISWGEILPLESEIDEAWEITWTVTGR